jgi:pimeloyl-ACP methyl ester carboxylesterase
MQFLSRDGVRLGYEEQGSGSPPMLLVHGWSCDHTHFAPQAEHFSKRHRVISVDLRGHGASDTPDQEYTMAGFADDLAFLCEQIGVDRPVVVGHSMGGVIAFEMAARHPDIVGAAVAIDAPLVPPAVLTGMLSGFVEDLKSPAYQDATRGFVNNVLFLPTDDVERKARIADQMAGAHQHVMASAMACIVSCDTAASAAGCQAPALVINAAAPLPDLDRLLELCPQIMIGQTVGAGHFNHLEVPDQVNAMIDRFMQVSL